MRKPQTRTAQKRKERRKAKRANRLKELEQHIEHEIVHHPKPRPVKPLSPKTEAQAHYLMSIEERPLTFGAGPAGTGKTYIAASMAARMLQLGMIEKIVVTRPVLEAEERLGFLPGDEHQKFAPYFAPVREVLEEAFGVEIFKKHLEERRIEIAPLAYMRGRTFKNVFVLLDEAQNTTVGQMKLFLTRLGENVTVVVNGDESQVDLPRHVSSGFPDALRRLEGKRGVGVVRFTNEDTVRSELVKMIVDAYDEAA